MIEIGTGDALIIVDLQNDFLPGGALPVPQGDQVITPLNEYTRQFAQQGRPIVTTRDWHPPNHCSFKAQGGPWPAHCVADTRGAQLTKELALPARVMMISKATRADTDAYSGFEGTDLDNQLKAAGIKRIFVGGLATDYCVLNTVRDGLRLGYRTYLLEDAIRGVEVKAGDSQQAIDTMLKEGAIAIGRSQLH
jgi:nicotinamidase/pyrazinamidase